MATFLENNSFSGKTLHLIATQGSSGFASSAKAVRDLVPNAEVKEGINVYCDDIPTSANLLKEWMIDRELVD